MSAKNQHGVFSPAVRNYALSVLVVVYTFNFIDRQILAILLPAIREEFGVSDVWLGFLTGTAFALFYIILGIPVARYADRHNRRNLIALALAVWSGMTALSGVAANMTHLVLARIGVGIGEAGCSPPAHSMIADYFPPERRSTAMGIFTLGISFGIMIAFLAGGWVVENIGWREAFLVVGIPGIVLALLVRLTGGIANPFALFSVFPVAVSAILLPPWAALLTGNSAFLITAGLIVCEIAAEPPHWPLVQVSVPLPQVSEHGWVMPSVWE